MSSTATLTQQPRPGKKQRVTPASAGLPDPRPVTDYDVAYAEPGGKSRITITLHQPCVIRTPGWKFIDVATGSGMPADSVKINSNTEIEFNFNSIIAATVVLVEAPYQDMQVQNFQGGFVRPGARWFRSPK